MTDQEQEMNQMEIENDICLTLEDLYNMLQKWDGEGHEEMQEEMIGYVAEWKAKLHGDDNTFDSEDLS